eukprot:s1379_g10.t2
MTWRKQFRHQEIWVMNTAYCLYASDGPQVALEATFRGRLDEMAKCLAVAPADAAVRLFWADAVVSIEAMGGYLWSAPAEPELKPSLPEEGSSPAELLRSLLRIERMCCPLSSAAFASGDKRLSNADLTDPGTKGSDDDTMSIKVLVDEPDMRFCICHDAESPVIIACLWTRLKGASVEDVTASLCQERAQWDAGGENTLLQNAQPEDEMMEEIYQSIITCPRPFWDREILKRQWRLPLNSPNGNGCALVSRSMEDAAVPKDPDRVRAFVHKAGALLRPSPQQSETETESEHSLHIANGPSVIGTELTSCSQIDMGGLIPSWATNYLSSTVSGKAVRWTKDLQRHCDARNGQESVPTLADISSQLLPGWTEACPGDSNILDNWDETERPDYRDEVEEVSSFISDDLSTWMRFLTKRAPSEQQTCEFLWPNIVAAGEGRRACRSVEEAMESWTADTEAEQPTPGIDVRKPKIAEELLKRELEESWFEWPRQPTAECAHHFLKKLRMGWSTDTNGESRPSVVGMLLDIDGATLKPYCASPLSPPARHVADPEVCVTILGGPKGISPRFKACLQDVFGTLAVPLLKVRLGPEEEMAHACLAYLRLQEDAGLLKAAVTDLLRLGPSGYGSLIASSERALYSLARRMALRRFQGKQVAKCRKTRIKHRSREATPRTRANDASGNGMGAYCVQLHMCCSLHELS